MHYFKMQQARKQFQYTMTQFSQDLSKTSCHNLSQSLSVRHTMVLRPNQPLRPIHKKRSYFVRHFATFSQLLQPILEENRSFTFDEFCAKRRTPAKAGRSFNQEIPFRSTLGRKFGVGELNMTKIRVFPTYFLILAEFPRYSPCFCHQIPNFKALQCQLIP